MLTLEYLRVILCILFIPATDHSAQRALCAPTAATRKLLYSRELLTATTIITNNSKKSKQIKALLALTNMRSKRMCVAAAPHLLLSLTLLLTLTLCCSTAYGWWGSEDSAAIVQRSKDDQIVFWEKEIKTLRQGEMQRALQKLYQKQAALTAAEAKQGFFYTKPEDKATIRLLDEDYRRSLIEVEQLKEQEQLMLAKLKPLYGVVSIQFAQEQKQTISDSIKLVQKVSYDNAWYSSLFSLREAESISDIIVGFIGQWLIGFIFMYPFAVLYYALWAAPWSVYAYTSGVADIVPAVVAYAVSVLVMCLPFIVLGAAFYCVWVVYKPQLQEAARRAQERRHPHYD
jgi:hypothetical protein